MPLLRRWFSLLSAGWSSGNLVAISVVQFKANEASNPATSVSVSFTSLPKVGNAIFVLAAIGGNPSDGNPTFSISDNQSGNTYTAQKTQSGASNGLSAECWSSLVNGSAGTFTITVTETGATTAWGIEIVAYEVSGIQSLTANSSTGTSGGSLPTINENGKLVLSIVTCNFSAGSPTFSYTGLLDGQQTAGLSAAWGRRNGVYSQSGGTLSFVIGVSLGFS